MTMCRTENKAFNRCYTMQSRFLKALGYLSNDLATMDEEEKIQMHADRLYHEMLEREKMIEEAKGAGRDAPVFEPLIQPDTTTKALGTESAWARARQRAQAQGVSTNLSSYPPEKQKEIKEKLQGKSDLTRLSGPNPSSAGSIADTPGGTGMFRCSRSGDLGLFRWHQV